MAAVEWNKKEELVEGQALRHLKVYAPILAAVAKSSNSELALIQKIQDYCYDNMVFMKCFQKIIISFYKSMFRIKIHFLKIQVRMFCY